MPDAVVVALITGACAIVAQLIISHMSNVKLFAEIERKSELSDEKLQGKIDVMNAAWGMSCSGDRVALFLNAAHKTTQSILKRKAFTVSLADRAHMEAAD